MRNRITRTLGMVWPAGEALVAATAAPALAFFYSLNALMDKVRDYGIERELYSR